MKQLLYAFISLACIVLVCRHIVNDLRQEERIVVLENQVKALQLKCSTKTEEYIKSDTIASHSDKRSTVSAKGINKNERRPNRDSIIYEHTVSKFDSLKFQLPIVLDLNTVDSATLTKVPGIGAKSARMIVRYREQLGGFHNAKQLDEVLTWSSAKEHMDEWCTLWFTADSSLIIRLNVNTADFRQILRHPYFNYEQTKELVNYRDKHKRINSWDDFEMMECFDNNDIEKLRFYLKF